MFRREIRHYRNVERKLNLVNFRNFRNDYYYRSQEHMERSGNSELSYIIEQMLFNDPFFDK